MFTRSALPLLRRSWLTFRDRVLGSFSWGFAGTIALQGSVLLSSVAVARILGIEEFGIYSVLVTTVLAFAGVAQGSVGITNTKFVGEKLHSDPRAAARTLKMSNIFTATTGLLGAITMIIGAPYIATSVIAKPHMEQYIVLAGVAVFFQTIATAQLGALHGFGTFNTLARAGLISGGLYVCSTAFGAWFAGLTGAVMGFVIAISVRCLFLWMAVREAKAQYAVGPAGKVPLSEWRQLAAFAIPASLASFVTLPVLWMVTALVARQPDGLIWAGLFGVAHQLRATILQAPALLHSVSFSVLSRLKGSGDVHAARQVFWTGATVNLVFGVISVSFVAVFAEPLLSLFGRQFVQGRELVIILILSVVPELISLAAFQLLQSAGRMWETLLLIVVPRDVMYLSLSATLLSPLGLNGAGAAYLAAYTFACVITLFVCRRIFQPRSPA